MFASPDFTSVEAFEVRVPERQLAPFVFNSPHSGRHYPQRFIDMSRLKGKALRRSEDFHVDELVADVVGLGAPLMQANFPRAYLDVNREPYELDPKMFVGSLPPYANFRSMRVAGGLGTVARIVAEGQCIYAGRIAVEDALNRIEGIYKPYHATLRSLLAKTHRAFGHAILIDCHSMPSSVRIGAEGTRPDFILGDRFGTSASGDLMEMARQTLTGLGYVVAINKPYAGGFITEHYGRPARGLHALQIEINRGLYFDEHSLSKRVGFDALRADLRVLFDALMGMSWHGSADYSLAAE